MCGYGVGRCILTWFDAEQAQSRWTESHGVVVRDEFVGVTVERRVVVGVCVVNVRHDNFFQPIEYIRF